MTGDILASLRANAEQRDSNVRAVALLRIARVQSATDRIGAQKQFLKALAAVRGLPSKPMEFAFLMEHARSVAVAIEPELLSNVPVSGLEFPQRDPNTVSRVMLEHGHVRELVGYIKDHDPSAPFPFGIIPALVQRADSRETGLELLRAAIQAWNRLPKDDFSFFWVFQNHWERLPVDEALGAVHAVVRVVLDRPDTETHSTYDNGADQITIRSSRADCLFKLLRVLRRLDPGMAEILVANDEQLAIAARRYPSGLDSYHDEMRAKSEALSESRPGEARRACFLAGQARDFPYLMSLLDAEHDGDFNTPMEQALERYREDTAASRPNRAWREFWPSTQAYREILHAVGKKLGKGAARFLDRIPNPDLQLFAEIEFEAALAGLPALSGARIGGWQ